MPRSGGTMTLTYNWPTDAAAGVNISSSKMQAQEQDIADEISNSIAADGQTNPTADLPMDGYKHTDVDSADARDQYARADQVQDSSLIWLGTSSGTNTITASATPSPGAYHAGQTFRFKAGGTNTTAATLNVNSLGAKSIKRSDGATALSAGDITSGGTYTVTYDGTNFVLSESPVISTNTLAKAWAKFTDTAGTIAIVSSFNVASIARTGTGQYTVTLTSGSASSMAVCGQDVAGSGDWLICAPTATATIFTALNGATGNAYNPSIARYHWIGF